MDRHRGGAVRALLVGLVLVASSCALRVSGSRVLPPELQFEPSRFPVSENEPARWVPTVHFLTLPNGVRVSYARQHHSEIIDVSVIVRCGRIDDEATRPGLSAQTLALAFRTGAGELDARAQKARGAALAFQPGLVEDDAESWLRFSVRTEDLPATLAFVAEALRAPRFEKEAVLRELRHVIARIDAAKSRPGGDLTFKARQRAAFTGPPQVLERPTVKSVLRTGPEDFEARARTCFAGRNLALAVSGDVTTNELRAAIEPLATIPSGEPVTHPPVPPRKPSRDIATIQFPQDHVEVTVVGRGLPPGARRMPAELTTSVLVSVLNSELRGFGEIYDLSATLDVGPADGATWLHFKTRPDVAWLATRRVVELLNDWWAKWPLEPKWFEGYQKRLLRWPPSARELAFNHARAGLQDLGELVEFDWKKEVLATRAHELSDYFAPAFEPRQLKIVVSGPVREGDPWGKIFER